MDLERDERLLEARTIFHPLVVGALFLAVALATSGVRGGHRPLVLGAIAGGLLVVLAAVWTQRGVLVTDRRVVEFSVVAAWLARRLPAFAGLEKRRRRVLPLGGVLAARRAGNVVVLQVAGGEHRIACHDDGVAAELVASIERQLLRSPRLRPVRRVEEPVIRVAAAAGAPGRCPYCHDDVPPDEAAGCAACGAGHHAECLEIHGGCAAFGCGAPARSRTRA